MIERSWHYGHPQGAQGPVRSGVLVEWLRTGALSPDTPVWTEGWDAWYPARDVEELAAAAWPRGAPRQAPARPAPRAQAPPASARPHSPGLAAAAGALVPGAGQAYNGQPGKALLVLLTAPLVLPWALGVWDALSVARKIAAAGGRTGHGGPAWLVVQGWAAVNLALFTLLGLTAAGWLR